MGGDCEVIVKNQDVFHTQFCDHSSPRLEKAGDSSWGSEPWILEGCTKAEEGEEQKSNVRLVASEAQKWPLPKKLRTTKKSCYAPLLSI